VSATSSRRRGLHARTDGFTSLAVVFGAIGVMLGFPLADPIVGLLITVAVLAVLRGVIRDIYRRLMDAVDPDLVDDAAAAVAGVPGVQTVDSVRLRWIGDRMRAETEITVERTLDVVQAHAVSDEAQQQLIHHVPRLDEVTVHVNPAPSPASRTTPPPASTELGPLHPDLRPARSAVPPPTPGGQVKPSQ